MGQKNSKGSVSIVNHDGRVRLRWRYQKKRYSLNLFQYNKANLHQAKKIAFAIEHDMVNETFDTTLLKYKPSAQTIPVVEKNWVNYFRDWVKGYRNRDCDRDVDYYLTKRMLERWMPFCPTEVVKRLNAENIAAKTYNTRLRVLRAFFTWARKRKLVDTNPLEDVLSKRLKKGPKDDRKPFREDEVVAILEAFKNNSFCPSSSSIKHSYYYPFIYFIFKMGVRNAEAIGLRVKHLNFERNVVEIREALARTMAGTHAGARNRKETKNGKERVLPMDKEAISILKPLLVNKNPDDLVFLSPRGLAIDDKMFQRRVFRKVLEGLHISIRVLYACRHTFGSRCIHEGLTPVMTAFLMGNNPETALRNYTHLIEIPRKLPNVSSR